MFKKEKYNSYEEFVKGFKVEVPENFNFAFDVMDRLAKETPDDLAMIHIDDDKKRRDYSFAFFARESAKLANGLKKLGLKKGDRVMVILYARWNSGLPCWPCTNWEQWLYPLLLC